ncbi:MAG: enoyl-ACP reductase [Candidatus Wallbacteria bacterium HGW-Wallbacteria-1]|jgi:enoyl-[acyl-carrier protein] reductase I|uniref:Enoyl-[acyl-carrier-protein] reductase [NADH] n=1 Tax=Candidatus Wallbacteria bacterium HGW-Wallbacteria-1 TaxID=2013854 RepID=A0A2N1PU91_9BACT|nr:MAG: enoyl-ACP reductase [Candidatus Wallbacteria bacterium HGW-Wallbacteria-1]
MSFLEIENRNFLVMGVANRKSVAYHIATSLEAQGANVILSVRDSEHLAKCEKLFPGRAMVICNVEDCEQIAALPEKLALGKGELHGFVHSIAFADYSEGIKPFHETPRNAFLQAVQVSAFSLVEVSNALRDVFASDASVVTISISTTSMAAESYGFMAPAKAALDSAVVFLAKSFSKFSSVRFNSVKAGLLKTSSSAGIPGYIDYYIFAEAATLRKESLKTSEVADTALFLLSGKSSGINAQGIVIDAGMAVNYYDRDIISKVAREV